MKKYQLFLVSVFLCTPLMAQQDSPITLKGMFGATYNQTGVSSNWTGTEKDSKNWGLNLDASAEKKFTALTWTNSLKDQFGKSEIAGSPVQISADLIDISSVLMYNWSIFANPYAGFNMITVNNTICDPVTYKESAGIGWAFLDRQKQHLKLRAGAAYVQQFQTNTETQRQTGVEVISNYDLTLSETAKFATEARFFTDFQMGPNLRWDNNIYLKVSKYITVALNYLEIYNALQQPKPYWAGDIETRFTVTIGLSYNIF